jgi:hypothetical protein
MSMPVPLEGVILAVFFWIAASCTSWMIIRHRMRKESRGEQLAVGCFFVGFFGFISLLVFVLVEWLFGRW